MAYNKLPNPIKARKINCAIRNCRGLGIALFRGKCYCKKHNKELKKFLGRFKI